MNIWSTIKSWFAPEDTSWMITLALSESGLLNRKDICIKNMGSTVACFCDSCMKEAQARMNKHF